MLLWLSKVYAGGGEAECDVLLVSERTEWGFDKGSNSRIAYGWEANQTLEGNLARTVSRPMCGMEETPQKWLTVLGWILGGQTYYNTHPCEPHGVINLYIMIPISEASVAHADKVGDWSTVAHRWTKDFVWPTSSKWSVSYPQRWGSSSVKQRAEWDMPTRRSHIAAIPTMTKKEHRTKLRYVQELINCLLKPEKSSHRSGTWQGLKGLA